MFRGADEPRCVNAPRLDSTRCGQCCRRYAQLAAAVAAGGFDGARIVNGFEGVGATVDGLVALLGAELPGMVKMKLSEVVRALRTDKAAEVAFRADVARLAGGGGDDAAGGGGGDAASATTVAASNGTDDDWEVISGAEAEAAAAAAAAASARRSSAAAVDMLLSAATTRRASQRKNDGDLF